MDIYKLLVKLGYSNKCSRCGHEAYSWSRLIGDIIFVSAFAIVMYFYLTSELPALRENANCTYMNIKEKEKVFSTIYNASLTNITIPMATG